MEKITVIVNKNNSDYINWQAELLYNSFLSYHKNDKNIDFIYIVINDNKPVNCEYPCYICKIKSQSNINGDNYIIYDRALSIKDFLESAQEQQRLFLFLESDFLFLKSFNITSDKTLGQRYLYMDLNDKFCRRAIDYYKNKINPSFNTDNYRPVGWPFLIKEKDLRSIIDRWIELTIKFRTEDPDNNPLYKNWICDMFGFNLALAEKEIIPDVIDITEMPPYSNKKEGIFSHYCYEVKNEEKIIFNKRNYKPWNLIDFYDKLGSDSKKLIKTINDYANLKKENNL